MVENLNCKEIDIKLVLYPTKMLNCFKICVSNDSNISIENIKCYVKEIDIIKRIENKSDVELNNSIE